TRIGARARVPSLASGNHIPGTVPAQTQIGQRAFQVRTTVLHGVQRRVITRRLSRGSSMVPNNTPRLVHSPVAAGLPPRNLNHLKTSLPKNAGQISQVHSYPLSKLGYQRDAQRDDTGGRQSHTGDPPLPLLKNTNASFVILLGGDEHIQLRLNPSQSLFRAVHECLALPGEAAGRCVHESSFEKLNRIGIDQPLLGTERTSNTRDLHVEARAESVLVPHLDGVTELNTRITRALDFLIRDGDDLRRPTRQVARVRSARAAELNPPVRNLQVASPILGDRRVVLVRLNRVVVRNPHAAADAKGRFFTFQQGEPDRVVEDAVPDFQGERPVLLDAGQGHITTLQNQAQGTPTHAGSG